MVRQPRILETQEGDVLSRKPQNGAGLAGFALPDLGVCVSRHPIRKLRIAAVSGDNYLNRGTRCQFSHDGRPAAQRFIVRMWRQNEARPRCRLRRHVFGPRQQERTPDYSEPSAERGKGPPPYNIANCARDCMARPSSNPEDQYDRREFRIRIPQARSRVSDKRSSTPNLE